MATRKYKRFTDAKKQMALELLKTNPVSVVAQTIKSSREIIYQWARDHKIKIKKTKDIIKENI
jgi:transposase-like protein